MHYQHLFFDMDKTIAPSREPIRPEMYELLSNCSKDIIIVSGQLVEKIAWQSNELKATYLGQNGNHAVAEDGSPLWHTPMTEAETADVEAHIKTLIAALPEAPNEAYNPIERRGGQITFSPIGNTAPIELKRAYDPDRSKRLTLLAKHPFVSDNMMVCIGGTTSLDYIPKVRHKGTNVKKLIAKMGWSKDECIYFGDGLYPGGNDEFVIGVIETVLVKDEVDCFEKLQALLAMKE
jgi:HAD superfamily hydrolase (TIGR01484 family)